MRREGHVWTLWTWATALVFLAPAALLVWLEPLTSPVAVICLAHAWVIPSLYARRGARSVVALGSERSAGRRGDADAGAEGVALGLLGDLVGHAERDLLAETGLAMQRGSMGSWLLGEQGALLVRPGGRRTLCWCVRIAEPEELPAGDHVAHLLLALREDEPGFAKVSNMAFSGATWRVRRKLPRRLRPALDAARRAERDGGRR